MVSLIDTHSHIDMVEFKDDFSEVLERAKVAGVEKIIIPSAEEAGFDGILDITDKYDNLYCAIGLHPSEVLKINLESIDKIKDLANHKKVVAIGECGLDYYYDKVNIKEQKALFWAQIKIANELCKPIIVHDRDAHRDCFELLVENAKVPVVMHCFSGSAEFAKECIKAGFYLAFGGVLTFKNAKKARESSFITPLDRLLVETDAPYLTPEPYRGQRNEPAFVRLSAEKLAEIKGLDFEEIAEATTANAKKVFGI